MPGLKTISYTYDKTQQTGKTTVLSPWSSRTQTFAYNLQGLLSEVTASTTSGSTTSVASKTVYGYDSDGARIRSTLYERFVPEGYDPENSQPETLVLKSTTEYLTGVPLAQPVRTKWKSPAQSHSNQ